MYTIKIQLKNGCLYDEVETIPTVDDQSSITANVRALYSHEDVKSIAVLDDISRQEQNKIFSAHNLEWIDTRIPDSIPREFLSRYTTPAPWWLVGYNLEDGEMMPVIALSHTGEGEAWKKGRRDIIKETRIEALKLAIKLRDNPGGRFVSEDVWIPL